MKEYIDNKRGIAVRVDEDNKCLLSYSVCDGEILEGSEGILKEVDTDIAVLLSDELDLKIEDYGVEIVHSTTISMPTS